LSPVSFYNPRARSVHRVVTYDSKNRIRSLCSLDSDFKCQMLRLYGGDDRGQTVTLQHSNGRQYQPVVTSSRTLRDVEKFSERLESYGFTPLLPHVDSSGRHDNQ
ncbi:MAG: hypothetical protein AAF497_11630, partial [Planctomycetota bacterium]